MNHVIIIAIGEIIITKDLVIVVPKYPLPQPILTKITYNFFVLTKDLKEVILLPF